MRALLLHFHHFSLNAKRFLALNFFCFFFLSFFNLLFNLYLKSRLVPESEIGHILSCMSLGSTLICFPASVLLHRVPFQKTLFFCMVGVAFGHIFQTFNSDLTLIKIGSFFCGAMMGIYAVSIPPFFMRNCSDAERVHLFSFHAASIMLSQLTGFFLAGHFPEKLQYIFSSMNDQQSYQYSILIGSLFVAFGALSFLTLKNESHFEKFSIRVENKWKKRLKDANWKDLYKIMIPRLFLGMGAGMIIPFLNLYLKLKFNMSTSEIGQAFSIQQIFIFFGMLLSPFISQRVGKIVCMLLTSFFSIPFMYLMGATDYLPLVLISFFIRGMLMNMSAPITSVFEMEAVEEKDRPLATALSYTAWNFSWTLATHWGGMAIEHYSFQYSFNIAIAMYVMSTLSYFVIFYLRKSEIINEQKY